VIVRERDAKILELARNPRPRDAKKLLSVEFLAER
jgi:hypothetical protein